ncbi:uncharacterized protein LOC123884392 [Trifolium pratense]|uniref:uncharacterized protein LOC123884392 n=1 Tax=Trifolium pratense TaxID=57577 RepID=UPI001E694C47|nr:uncharacterized protein LOC123884392 [Trifolium pratense]
MGMALPSLSANTRAVQKFSEQDDAQTLCISNPNITSLTVGTDEFREAHNYKVVFCTPKLISLSITGRPTYLALSSSNLPFIEEVLNLVTTQPPCFVRLKSLKVELRCDSKISSEEVRGMVNHLLQNSLQTRVDIIKQPCDLFGKMTRRCCYEKLMMLYEGEDW